MLTICISGFQVLALDEQSRQDWNLTERDSSGNVRNWQIKLCKVYINRKYF